MRLKTKDKIKIYFFPHLVSFLHKMGISYKRLGEISFFAKSNLIAQANDLKNFKTVSTEKPQYIYVLLILPGSIYHLAIEALLALGLKKRGHNITFVIDDNTLPIHELKRIGEEKNWDYTAQRDFILGSKILTNMGLEWISISDFIKNNKGLHYKNKYNSILEATLLKHYKVGMVTSNLPMLNNKKQLIKNAISISDEIGNQLVKLRPDKVIMSHGIYSTWGPAFYVLTKNKIPVLVHSRGKKKYSQVFNWNKTGDSWDVSEEWEKVKNIGLTKKQAKEIKNYLASRISHKNDVFVYNFGKATTKEETIKKLGLDNNKPIYTLFTNVLWDAASAQREIAFKNPIEWVIETIKWFNSHPDKQLIVKIHPAEIVIGTNMPFYDIITSKVKPSNNIKIIKPEEKVNSWSIYDITDLGLVHTTTAGMELPLVKKACAVVSQTHYRGKGFTIDIDSKEEYFNVLDNFDPNEIDYEKQYELALRYAYLLFIRYQIPFNYFFEKISTSISGFKYNNVDQYFSDRNFNSLIEKIIKKENILLKKY